VQEKPSNWRHGHANSQLMFWISNRSNLTMHIYALCGFSCRC
jgi:hypothetical protein